MDKFAHIRPYHDDEIDDVIADIINDDECIRAILALKFPAMPAWCMTFIKPLLKTLLRFQVRDVHNVLSFQEKIGHYMDHMLETQTSGFKVSGLDNLPKDQAYVFVSNHRDIAMDPAFTNYALYHNGRNTVRIAIGDNLLTQDFATRLMRINKSFIVNRSERSPKKLLANLKLLSEYIAHSIKTDKHSIWIAQREGRAKDGIDNTDSAILKMFAIAGRKQDFSSYMHALNIVPLSVSYEYDPCDSLKAKELLALANHGEYVKAEQEDVQSIAEGIAGFKGKVHLHFGEPFRHQVDGPDQLAEWLDEQIIGNYVLHATNYFAYYELYGHYPEGVYGATREAFSEDLVADQLQHEKQRFDARLSDMDADLRQHVLQAYANPICSKQRLGFMPK